MLYYISIYVGDYVPLNLFWGMSAVMLNAHFQAILVSSTLGSKLKLESLVKLIACLKVMGL